MTSPAGIAADRRPFAAAGDPASRVQEARAEHAPQIAALYRAVYADKRPDDAVDHYPFPQFMNEVWLRSTIAGRTFRWLVATGDGTVVGSAVGVRLPEATSTGLAETCGVVVRPDFRRRGIGARLLTALERLIEGDFCLALAETRTADNGGWELFRRAGYVPLGFEPSAHRTPAGLEPMLMQGRRLRAHRPRHNPVGRCSAAVQALAVEVLQGFRGDTPFVPVRVDGHHRQEAALHMDRTALEIIETLDPDRSRTTGRGAAPTVGAAGLEEVVAGPELFSGANQPHRRFTRCGYDAAYRGTGVAAAAVVADSVDRRACIRSLRLADRRMLAAVVGALAERLRRRFDGSIETLVVNARADDPAAHEALESLGFFPTVYFPAAVVDGDGRVDTVQFTRCENGGIEDSTAWVSDMDWPEAKRIVDLVESLANRRPGG